MEAAKDFYTVKEVAELAGIFPDAVRRQINRGALKAAKINGGFIIDREEAERYLEKRKAKQGA